MYSQSGFGFGMSPGVKNLIMINVAVYLVQLISYNLGNPYYGLLHGLFSLTPSMIIENLFVWQVGTYMFLHSVGSFTHILFNMFALWMFGVQLEEQWGTKEFYRYYLITGLLAGVSIFLWNWQFIDPRIPTLGASGAVFGILIAYGLFFPDRYIYLNFLFPIKAKYLILIWAIIELVTLPSQDGISHIGHLGGMVAGYFYIRHRYAKYGIGRDFFRNFFNRGGGRPY